MSATSGRPCSVSRTFSTPRHTTHCLESGPADGPLMIFLHGWPSIGLIWRAQLEAFAAEGWHCVAPDLRGLGGSSAPAAPDAYTTQEVVADLVELHDHLGGAPAIWVGHDWGSVVAGAVAAHEARARPRRRVDLVGVLPGLQRPVHPRAAGGPEALPGRRIPGRPVGLLPLLHDPLRGRRSPTSRPIRPRRWRTSSGPGVPTGRQGRGDGDDHARRGALRCRAPRPGDTDPALWPAADFDVLVDAFATTGFRGSCAWYNNDEANIAYAREAPDQGRLGQPVLFVNGDWDPICGINGNREDDPMRAACADLTVTTLPAGHWLPLERKTELVEAIRRWLERAGL